jgi:hypothetical protein
VVGVRVTGDQEMGRIAGEVRGNEVKLLIGLWPGAFPPSFSSESGDS